MLFPRRRQERERLGQAEFGIGRPGEDHRLADLAGKARRSGTERQAFPALKLLIEYRVDGHLVGVRHEFLRFHLLPAGQPVVNERIPVRKIARPVSDRHADPVAVSLLDKRARRGGVHDRRPGKHPVHLFLGIHGRDIAVEERDAARFRREVERKPQPFEHLLREGVLEERAVGRLIQKVLRVVVGRFGRERDPAPHGRRLFHDVGKRFIEPGVLRKDPAIRLSVPDVRVLEIRDPLFRALRALEDAPRKMRVQHRRRGAVPQLRTGIGLGEQHVDAPAERLALISGAQEGAGQKACARRGIVGVVEPDDGRVPFPRQDRGDLRRPLATVPASAVGAGDFGIDLVDARPHLANAPDERVDLRPDEDPGQGIVRPLLRDMRPKLFPRERSPRAAVELRQVAFARAPSARTRHQAEIVVEHDHRRAVGRERSEHGAEMRPEGGIGRAADLGRLPVREPHKFGKRRGFGEMPSVVTERRLHQNPRRDPPLRQPVAEKIERFAKVFRLFPRRRPDRDQRHHEKRNGTDAFLDLPLDIVADLPDLFGDQRHNGIVLQFHVRSPVSRRNGAALRYRRRLRFIRFLRYGPENRSA